MTILHLINSRERDLGGFTVRRVLPAAERQMVGPFVFFDHMGPVNYAPGEGMDVRPHPHVALATVTYLFTGVIEHRDSLGFVQEVRPGDVNWMTAGHGIVHSERTPRAARGAGGRTHGIQSWVALPDGQEDVDPDFVHHPAATLPTRQFQNTRLTVIAGEAFGMRSPVATLWPMFYVHAEIPAGAELTVADEYGERAVYVVQGAVATGDATLAQGQITQAQKSQGQLAAGQMAVFASGAGVTLRGLENSRVMLLGGEKFPTPRYLFWNFVASSPERIERAKERWSKQEFARVPGETEFIPLPGS